jgi:hypothetical protein
VGVHEKSELKKISLGINYVKFKVPPISSLIGFRGALFFCFFYFGRAKEKKEDGTNILSSFTMQMKLGPISI